ncbi:MAG: MinD/ParA family protein [Pirellulales bacterium]|nr:MinD/ParA family protein [Pirellulales bacterium]
MSDQADQLRTLVQAATAGDTMIHAPPIVAFASGRPGVGVTTVAVHVAIALCRMDFQVVLVDADLDQPGIADLCQVTQDTTIAEVFSGRRTVQEALVQGPVGIQILPGTNRIHNFDQFMTSQDRLVTGLKRLGSITDIILLDLGGGMNPGVARIWQESNLILLMTTIEPDVVMDAYAAIKWLDKRGRETMMQYPGPNKGWKQDSTIHEGPSPTRVKPATQKEFQTCKHHAPMSQTRTQKRLPPIAAVIRGASEPSVTIDVHHRLASACQRFLGIELQSAPSIPGLETIRFAVDASMAPSSDPRCSPESYNAMAHYVASSVGLIDHIHPRGAA